MREILEQLLQSVDVPNSERAQIHWDEYRTGSGSSDPAVKAGADAAFATLLAWYGATLYRHIWGFIRSDAAEDVLQDVLRKLHENRQSPRLADFHANVLPWLRTVAIRECVDAHRRAARRRSRESRVARPETESHTESRDELQEVLAVALTRLTPDEKQAIALHYFEGHDKQQTAAILGVNRNTLSSRLTTALTRLQKFVPAPAGILVGGSISAPAVLTARPPTLSATRLSELVSSAWVKSGEVSWSATKVAAVALIGLVLCGASVVAAWQSNNNDSSGPGKIKFPNNDVTERIQPISVRDRNLSVFHEKVKPLHLKTLRSMYKTFPGSELQADLDDISAFDTRIRCIYSTYSKDLPKPSNPIKHILVFDASNHSLMVFDFWLTPESRATSMGFNTFNDLPHPQRHEFDSLDHNDVSKQRFKDMDTAFKLLPKDELTVAAATDRNVRIETAIKRYSGTWYLRGDPLQRCELKVVNGGFYLSGEKVLVAGIPEIDVRVPGWWLALEQESDRLTSLDGRLRITENESRLDLLMDYYFNGQLYRKPWWTRRPY